MVARDMSRSLFNDEEGGVKEKAWDLMRSNAMEISLYMILVM